jgi:hypothetical protein
MPQAPVLCQTCDVKGTKDKLRSKARIARRRIVFSSLDQLKDHFSAFDSVHFTLLDLFQSRLKNIITALFENKLELFNSSGASLYNYLAKGSFSQLMNTDTFGITLFPGMTDLETSDIFPQTISDLLYWEPITINFLKLLNSSMNVFLNVKKRGFDAGDVMGKDIENVLIPQILLEALGNELIDSVHQYSKKLSQMKSQSSSSLATWSSNQQQQQESVGHLNRSHLQASNFLQNKVYFQNEFLGNEWSTLIFSDAMRYVENEKMTEVKSWHISPSSPSPPSTSTSAASVHELMTNYLLSINQHESALLSSSSSNIPFPFVTVVPKSAWINDKSTLMMEEGYPALNELIKQLHLLPYEMNGG